MTYEIGGADAVDEPTNPAVNPLRSPPPVAGRHALVDTNFTSTRPGAPTRQPGLSTPGGNELGLIRPTKPVPRQGWRKMVHRLTAGKLNPGESAAESLLQALTDRINQPVPGSYSIAVLSLKGGVGKTTTTFALGATFASLRGDRVIAVDANPDFGTLARRGPNQSRSTVRNLLLEPEILRYPEMRRHTSQSTSRLEILASERDPAISEAFSEGDYRAVHRILDRFYNIILMDCGTGLTHSATRGVLGVADALVVVASPAIDSARSALATLDWLQYHGYAHLVPDASVVLSSARPGAMPINVEQLTQRFQSQVRSIFVVPYDHHLAAGGEITLELLNRKTRGAYMQLAASVADGFRRPTAHPVR
ncbi:MinD/ParA family protein [Mycobacterium sp. 1245801.1]|uniref:MinD/ParA family ATP-binding protein n=1 Tax=Mycobacterium sp. 1245801.1 TaxID=1834075 RepID=UPI000B231AC6|nr:MinD/ParA family protein [Mycobacterium sp. 1245801.1]